MIKKIISGGQTGADRAALDVAIKLGITHGGWIPKGRITEEGSLPDKYRLQEMPTDSYPKRTEQDDTFISSIIWDKFIFLNKQFKFVTNLIF